MNTESNIFSISESDFNKLLDTITGERDVFMPEPVTTRSERLCYSYASRSLGTPYTYIGYRCSQPLKTFFFSGRMKVSEYLSSEQSKLSGTPKPIALVGVSACDIESLKSLDTIFLQDTFTDIFYREKRKNTLIISIDCTEPRETCLCTLAGIGPYPTAGFDFNLSKIENSFVVELGSDKGREIYQRYSSLFSRTKKEILKIRDNQRAQVTKNVQDSNKNYQLSRSRREILETLRENEDWFDHVSPCVECGACLFACPTCHCFLLFDQKGSSGVFQRLKDWDACSYAGYSRMAGGSSPRLGIMDRFRHRYLHKFEYFPKNYGFEMCSGCGRCIEGCMGKIDMRKVLKALDTTIVGTNKR